MWSDQTVNEEPIEAGMTTMREAMEMELARQNREEVLREVATNHRVRALLATRGRRAGRRSILAWEAQRLLEGLLKRFRAPRKSA